MSNSHKFKVVSLYYCQNMREFEEILYSPSKKPLEGGLKTYCKYIDGKKTYENGQLPIYIGQSQNLKTQTAE